jgi:FtsP/CotA-like multicopper oxidase with cupredoxin domain
MEIYLCFEAKLTSYRRIEVNVMNNLTDEGTALHWHGILQTGTPWFDGVPSVSQCPIPPGGTLVYRFRADLYGTSWYHCKSRNSDLGIVIIC